MLTGSKTTELRQLQTAHQLAESTAQTRCAVVGDFGFEECPPWSEHPSCSNLTTSQNKKSPFFFPSLCLRRKGKSHDSFWVIAQILPNVRPSSSLLLNHIIGCSKGCSSSPAISNKKFHIIRNDYMMLLKMSNISNVLK